METITVVIDLECSYAPMPIGRLVEVDEDTVIYTRPTGMISAAPLDCVLLIPVQVKES